MPAENLIHSGDRILVLLPELLGVGGIQEAGRLTAAALAEIAATHGCHLDFLSLNDPPGPHTLSSVSGNLPYSGFGRTKSRFMLSAIPKIRKNARIILAAHPHLALPAALLRLFQPSLKIAVISHGVEVWHRLPFLRRRAFLEADILMAPSRYTVEQIIQIQGAPRAKTRRVSWPLNPHILRMASQHESLTPPPGFPEGLVVLSVTRLVAAERYKGVDQLIRAVAHLAPKIPALHLVIVGGGDDLPRHQALAAELSIAPRVHFLDARSPEEVAASYSRCDIFALPSTGEGFGFVFLEAMAFGKPVVAVAAGGVTDIIEHGENGLLVPPASLGRLIESLERLLLKESLRIELGQKGAECVHSRYQFETFRRDLEHVLMDCGLASNERR